MRDSWFVRAGRATWRFAFHDEVRLLEVFSMLNLLAWCELLLAMPGILDHNAYRGFAGTEAFAWAYFFGAVGLFQFAAMLWPLAYPLECRFIAMALAAGSWAVIAWNFWAANLPTTANLNYSLLAGVCAISGAYLAWKSTSYQS